MTRVWDFFRFLILALGALVAPRALGANALELASQATQSIFENPELVALGTWAATEIAARLFPTRRQASTFFFLRDILNLVGTIFLFSAKVFEQMAQSPLAQNLRAPKVSAEDALKEKTR